MNRKPAVLRILAASATALVAGGLLAGCSTGDSASGGVLRVTLANHVWSEYVMEHVGEFEQQSGIDVEITELGEDQLSDQYNVKLNAGSDELDVMMYRPLQEGKLFAENGYFADLTDRVSEDAEWNWADFQPGPVAATSYEGQVVGVPIITERETLYYRKDLLEAAGLEVPKTLDELQSAAEKISAENPGVAGFVARTARAAAVTQFSSFLYSFGGEWIADGASAIDSPEARDAYAYYGGLLHDHGPANISTDMSWTEAMAIFTQGNAAFYTEADSLYKNATDPANSKVADTVGFAPFPAGPAGSRPYNIPSWALGINSASGNQDAAWEFVKWATSAEQTLAIQQAGVPGPRTSVWDNPAGIADYPADLAEAIIANSANGVGEDRPLVVRVPEAREIVGDPIVAAIVGDDLDAAIEQAGSAFSDLLADEQ